MADTLFGHLSSRFTSSPENIATEGLNFILNRSHPAGEALIRFVNQSIGTSIQDKLSFSTQSTGEDQSIPDLVGKNSTGKEILVCEAKFWAGLTDNQPVNYLKRLQKGKEGILLFLCPEKRIPTIWPELVRRCQEARVALGEETETPYTKSIPVGNDHHLAITSWRAVLNSIQPELERENDHKRISDLEQLRGLVNKMDQEAFLPLSSEELSVAIPKRLIQYHDLVDEAIEELRAKGVVSLDGLRATQSRVKYRRYFSTEKFVGWLEVEYDKWTNLRETPIWLGIQEPLTTKKWKYPENLKPKLQSLEYARPSMLFEGYEHLTVPIYLPTGQEKSVVVQKIIEQFLMVKELLE